MGTARQDVSRSVAHFTDLRERSSNPPGPAHYAAGSARLTRRGPRGAAGRQPRSRRPTSRGPPVRADPRMGPRPHRPAGVHVPGARPQGHLMRRRDWPARNEALRELGMSTRVTTQRWQGPGDVPTRSRRVDPQWGKPLRRAERGHLVDCEAPFGQQLHHVPVRQCVACTPLRPSDHQRIPVSILLRSAQCRVAQTTS